MRDGKDNRIVHHSIVVFMGRRMRRGKRDWQEVQRNQFEPRCGLFTRKEAENEHSGSGRTQEREEAKVSRISTRSSQPGLAL